MQLYQVFHLKPLFLWWLFFYSRQPSDIRVAILILRYHGTMYIVTCNYRHLLWVHFLCVLNSSVYLGIVSVI